MRKNHTVYLFYSAYRAMNSDDNPTFKSQRTLAKEISKEVGISPRSAARHWQQAKREYLVFAQLAKEASARAAKAGGTASAIKLCKQRCVNR